MAAMPTHTATTVDEYLAALPTDKRAALQWLRRHIRAAAPGAEECISYGIPAFRLDGKLLVHFGAAARHCAFYPGAVVESHKDDLAGYDTSKGTVRFPPDAPLPAGLIRKLVKAQIARRAARRQRPAPDTARRVTSRRMLRPQEFVQRQPAAFERESGAWGRQGCTAVRLDSVDEDTLGAALTLARRNVESRPAGRTRPRRVPARVGGRKT